MRYIYFLIVLLGSQMALADGIKRPDSYNYTRGVEAVQNNNPEEALEFLNKELAENPKNGYAFAFMALLKNYSEEYGKALSAANEAIKLIPTKDKEYQAFAYSIRGKVYLQLEDTVRALKDYARVIDIDPHNPQGYSTRAELYYNCGQYELADRDYRQMIILDEGDATGHMGLGRNAFAQKRFEDGIVRFSQAIKLDSECSQAYAFRAEGYIALKRYDEAIDDVIRALSMDGNQKAISELKVLADSAMHQMVTKLKIQKMKEQGEAAWDFYLGMVYEIVKQYKKAIHHYSLCQMQGANPVVAYRIAYCYIELGDFDKALLYCNQSIEQDSTDMDYIFMKAQIEDYQGKYDEAIRDMNLYLTQEPERAFGYYRRGWIKDHNGDWDGAIDDYSLAIALEPKYAYTYLNRGVLYKLKGETVMAESDFRQVLLLDTIAGENNVAHYAYFYLGETEKAKAFMEDVLRDDGKGNYYDAACLYSLMGDTAQSLKYLQKALEKGYRTFVHIKRDRDLENLRQTVEYATLIEEYENIQKQALSEDEKEDSSYVDVLEEISFTKEGDMCKVKCFINGLPLHFIFDTGASDVSISAIEATFMMKNGYLTATDVIGKQNYMTADGSVSEGTVINLKEVKMGNLHLTNIKASVIKNQSAPLLLGQSVLNRLGKIEIDNNQKVIRVTYKQKQ